MIGLVVFQFLVIPQADARALETIRMLPSLLGVSGLVVATVGLSIGLQRARPTAPVYLRSITVTLAVLAALLGLAIASYAFMLSRGVPDGTEHVFRYLIAICTLLGTSLVALCVLRACRVRAAAVLTPAFALIALPVVPFGTAGAVAWFVWARKRETSAL